MGVPVPAKFNGPLASCALKEEQRFPRGTEALFQNSELTTVADFVEGPIDYIHQPQAYDYSQERVETERGGG
jgi:hypothetical protein